MIKATSLRSEKGFTLIEVLLVVALIGIVAYLATPSYLAMLARG